MNIFIILIKMIFKKIINIIKMKFVILISLISIIFSDSRIKIDIYTESLCPDCV